MASLVSVGRSVAVVVIIIIIIIIIVIKIAAKRDSDRCAAG
jgi:hypothetical protein